jgi:serine protease Do
MKKMNEIIDTFRKCVVQIATPYSGGTGFILFNEGLIVTNYHVVKNCEEVVVNGREFEKTAAKVVFIDPHLDVAFIESPVTATDGPVLSSGEVNEGDTVLAIGHPLGLKYTSTSGIISKTERDYNGIKYFQIDAAINPGNSGGPLINSEGEIIGMNTFIIRDAESLAFSLPFTYIRECLESYSSLKGSAAIRCRSCRLTQKKEDISGDFCNNCGFRFDKDDIHTRPFVPEGIVAKIEKMIEDAGFDPGLSRGGPMFWDFSNDDFWIKITYIQTTKFIVMDAPVAMVPKDKIGEFFEFALKENFKLTDLVFSLMNNELMLSALTFEDDFHEDVELKKLKDLMSSSTKYRKDLKMNFDAEPILDTID